MYVLPPFILPIPWATDAFPSLPMGAGLKTKKAHEPKVIYLAGKVEVDCACVLVYCVGITNRGEEKKRNEGDEVCRRSW